MFLITNYTNFCNVGINININLYYLNEEDATGSSSSSRLTQLSANECIYDSSNLHDNMVGISVVFLVSINSCETRCYMLIPF